MKRFTHGLLVVMVILALSALPGMAAARQAGGSVVSYDAPVEGEISSTAFSQSWTFEPVSADRIKIMVERLDGNLFPDVSLLDSSGNTLATSYGPGATHDIAVIDTFTLPAAGSYQIVVGRESGETGTTTGTYRLTVTPLALAADNPNNNVVTGPVTYDTPLTGEITPVQWRNLYTLSGDAGDVVTVTAERLSGTLYPEVHLLDANNTDLSVGYVDLTWTTAEITGYTLPGAGDYTVLVTRDRGIDGETLGSFQLTASLMGSGEGSSRLTSNPPQTIGQYDTPVQGEITNEVWYQDWQFRTEAADIVNITVDRMPEYSTETPNNFVPHVILLGAAGQELTRAWVDGTGAEATIDHFNMPGPGTYIIRVTRDSEKNGYTTGTYALTVTLEGSGENSPLLAGTDGEVTVDLAVKGQISNARWLNTWTFSGQQGQVITITAERSGGTLFPYLELMDANGSLLYQCLCGGYARYSDD